MSTFFWQIVLVHFDWNLETLQYFVKLFLTSTQMKTQNVNEGCQ